MKKLIWVIIEQNNPLKKENKNILSYPSTTKEKKKNNYKKIDAYNYIKGRQENKNRLENQKNSYKKINDYSNLNSYTQYSSLYSENNKKLINSMKMRSKKLSGINNSETQNKSRDKSKDKNEEKFKLLYNKFLEDEKKKQKSIERMKEKKEEEEKKLYVFQPIINKKSKELTAKSKENQKDFYIRQKELLEQYKKNEDSDFFINKITGKLKVKFN